ncbi:MAG: hypothetical protein M1828_004850 [Chrysothrix sp. TS-e1954]|nr:MAG: hypothetical protein M1828_004850 [Chrysothrix sp. TS-e1954]
MPRLQRVAVLLAAAIVFVSPVAADLRQQGDSKDVADEESFQSLLKGVPDAALHKALHGHHQAFRDGVFDHERTAAQVLHEEDPALATKVVEAARHDLAKRQISDNSTTTTTSVLPTTTIITSESPSPTTSSESSLPTTSSESPTTSPVVLPPTTSSSEPTSTSETPLPTTSSEPTSAPDVPNGASSQGSSSGTSSAGTSSASSAGDGVPGSSSGGSTTGSPGPSTSVSPFFSMPLMPASTPLPSSVQAGISSIVAPQGPPSNSPVVSSDSTSAVVPVTTSSAETPSSETPRSSPAPTSAPVTTSTHTMGNVVTTTDQFGNQIMLTGAADGAVITATDVDGRVVTTTYHPEGGAVTSQVLQTSTLPDGSPTTLTSVAVVGVSGPGGATATEGAAEQSGTGTGQAGLVTGNAAVASRKMGKEVVALVGGAVGVAWLL